jgi:hypothetical protein
LSILPAGPDNLYTSAAHLRLARADRADASKTDMQLTLPH